MGTNCFHGHATQVTFDLSDLDLAGPTPSCGAVAFNTQSYGAAPVGVDGPWNSLNVGADGNRSQVPRHVATSSRMPRWRRRRALGTRAGQAARQRSASLPFPDRCGPLGPSNLTDRSTVSDADVRKKWQPLGMTLHARDSVRDQLDDCVFAGHDLSKAMPKYRFPDDEMAPDDVFQVVHDELMLDGNSRQNLATFCQTWEEPEVHAVDGPCDRQEHDRQGRVPADGRDRAALRAHARRPVERPRVGEHRRRVGDRFVRGLHARRHGREVALAGQARGRGQAHRPAEHGVRAGAGGVAQVRQVLGHRDARGADVAGALRDDAEDMLERVDENTIMVVPTFGVTYTGSYEMVEPLADALDQLQADTGLDIDIHVDGASGAFLAPFCAPDLEWDFRLPRVKSISTSGHKFGLAPLGVGWVIWRDAAELPDDLIFHVTYLGGDMPVFQINFSRPAGQIVAQYYDFLRLGREGYRRVHQASYDTCAELAEEIVKLGPFELVCDSDPRTGIPAVTWKLKDGADPGYTLYDLADRLRIRGWQVPAYPLTGAVTDVPVQRILVRQDVSRDLAAILLDDFEDAVAHFDKHPVVVSMTKEESSGFSHL